ADFVKKNYPDSKADLMACFMEAGLKTLKTKGFLGMINQHSWMFLSSYETLREKLIDNTFFDTLLHLGPRTFPEIGGEVVQNASFTFWKTTKEDEKGAYLRLVDYGQSSIKKEKTLEAIQNPNCGWFYTANQKDFEKIPGSPIGYWLSDNIFNIFKNQKTILDISESEGQTKSGNNDKFLRLYWEINKNNFGFANKWVKHPKGGSFRRWYGNLETVINWSEKARKHYRKDRVARILVEKLWWKKGVSWTLITSGKQSFRDYDDESIFNLAAPTLFFNKELNRLYILGLLNTPITETLLKVYNPTLNCNIGEVQSIPLVENLQEELVTKKVENLISCSKQEWNSRETSWDFEQNELLKHRGYDVEESYDLYQQYWKTQFFQLHQNEEELNRQFIEIYGLEDELTPDVPLEDITILKEEAKIVDNQLVFQQGEIFKQFMSYAVGCMFGRYSLDKKGLVLANQGETLADYLEQLANSRVEHPSFTPDADNIIPILDDEWFEDDIVGRFKEFLKVSFGTENYEKNLAFVDECLGGKGIRKYFTKDFYPDHIKRYKKRPIYWMFSSPTGSFNVLIYMHRYTPDTLNKVLNDYLKEYREKLKTELERLEHIKNTGSSREQTLATKDQDRINKVLLELNEYEREVLYPIASQRINIDLDDGVLVNYNKFGKAIKEVKGLNDKAAKAKVKKFDWIDKTSIQ
ncbi:MAG: BREX-1 system adenine-specific DNA-methyltransferase PglX, partial [Cytophagales bacterium]|nr:BREX-1 system adenine-specific DNA-methyltransferase PglX [Cytophagales bacterium]